MDAQSGTLKSGAWNGNRNTPKTKDIFGQFESRNESPKAGDSGGASRFFYCAKANRKERELGCDDLPARAGFEAVEREEGSDGLASPRTGAGRTAGKVRNFHPTVKPLDLCRYLATLIKPPSAGRILVPFSGSGSEMIGAMLAGWQNVTGIEGEADYIDIAHARIAHYTAPRVGQEPLFK